MPKFKTIEEAYCSCEANGHFKVREAVSKEQIKTMAHISGIFLESAQDLMKVIDKKSPKWSVVYTLHYDAIRELAEIIVLFDDKKIANHQCLFAYLCKNHSDLDLDWNFFEKIRTKRNGLDYYGNLITYEDWKEAELQAKLYLNVLKKAVEEKIQKL
ncbi:MAG: hypothetical protein WC852_03350 [Candidatus Nanoarchaeia archaeon]|jgi:hypothetical protein